MVRVPSETEEDMRRPERERERLVSERIALENRIENLLCLHGIAGFKPRLKKAAERLDGLRSFAGAPLPPMPLEELNRLMTRHRMLSEQLREIEAAREQAAMAAEPDCAVQQIQMLARLVGLGLATATGLTREVFCRSFADRRAIAGFVGLTGTPFNSGGSNEQGIVRTAALVPYSAAGGAGCASVDAPSCWFVERTGGVKGRIPDHGGGTRLQLPGAARRDRRSPGRRASRRRLRGDSDSHAPTQVEAGRRHDI
jgi:transposase